MPGIELDSKLRCFTKNEKMIYTIIRKKACADAEKSYLTMIENAATPQIARSVLPNSLKTEIVMTMNLREWRHFFSLRADKVAHPQIRVRVV